MGFCLWGSYTSQFEFLFSCFQETSAPPPPPPLRKANADREDLPLPLHVEEPEKWPGVSVLGKQKKRRK